MTKRVVITGASAGIGRETALALAAAGVDVVAVARRPRELESLGSLSARILPVAADVTTAEGQARVARAVGAQPLAALLHGAGVFPRGLIPTLTAADWETAMAVNVYARLQLVLALRSSLRGGRVLFVGSDAATTPRPGGAAYSVTKAASAMLRNCLAAELGAEIDFGIAKPGLVETAMLDDSLSASRDSFPAGSVYAGMKERGETIPAATVARFFRFLLLDIEGAEFAREGWDIRDPSHHPRWLSGKLYRGV